MLSTSRAGAPLATPFESESERAATLAWLAALDRDPAPLHGRARNPKLTRLGFYAESLLEYFLTHGPSAGLVAANVPLRHQRRTIGECDFLLHTARGARLHWELAVKFYLHIGEVDGLATLAHFVGPNLQDRFDLKHARLLHHQLALSARDEFVSLGFDGPWRAELFVKGRLFYRDDRSATRVRTRRPNLPSIICGAGGKRRRSGGRRRTDETVCFVAQIGMDGSRTLSAQEGDALVEQTAVLSERVARCRRRFMVARYERCERYGWREHSRGFIVPAMNGTERAADFAG